MQTITSYEVQITRTSKPMGRTEQPFSIFDEEMKRFSTKEEAKKYIAEQYYYCKTKRAMYKDTAEGQTIKVGYVYSFKNKDWSHNSDSWYQQDWVVVKETISKPILL